MRDVLREITAPCEFSFFNWRTHDWGVVWYAKERRHFGSHALIPWLEDFQLETETRRCLTPRSSAPFRKWSGVCKIVTHTRTITCSRATSTVQNFLQGTILKVVSGFHRDHKFFFSSVANMFSWRNSTLIFCARKLCLSAYLSWKKDRKRKTEKERKNQREREKERLTVPHWQPSGWGYSPLRTASRRSRTPCTAAYHPSRNPSSWRLYHMGYRPVETPGQPQPSSPGMPRLRCAPSCHQPMQTPPASCLQHLKNRSFLKKSKVSHSFKEYTFASED